MRPSALRPGRLGARTPASDIAALCRSRLRLPSRRSLWTVAASFTVYRPTHPGSEKGRTADRARPGLGPSHRRAGRASGGGRRTPAHVTVAARSSCHAICRPHHLGARSSVSRWQRTGGGTPAEASAHPPAGPRRARRRPERGRGGSTGAVDAPPDAISDSIRMSISRPAGARRSEHDRARAPSGRYQWTAQARAGRRALTYTRHGGPRPRSS